MINALPDFSQLNITEIKRDLELLLTSNKESIDALIEKEKKPNWENFIYPIEIKEDALSQFWSPIRHLHSVVDSDELRKAYTACLPLLSTYSSELGQHAGLYAAYKKIEQDPSYLKLDSAQQKSIQNALRDFHLSGIDLPENDQKLYRDIQKNLSEYQNKYEQNLLDATQSWEKLITDKKDLSGLPDSALTLMQQNAEQQDKQGWLLKLDPPSYMAAITYADNRKLREEIYTAYTTRASDQGPDKGRWDNSSLMEKIISLRQKKAQLLGFENYAQLSLSTKMADSVLSVKTFLDDLARRSKATAEKEIKELKNFAEKDLGISKLAAWDVAYASEKLRHKCFDFSDEDLKPYFPAEQVIKGLFELSEKLFDVFIAEKQNINTWHKDVKFYEIKDKDGEIRGCFYLDAYARPHKRGGAWMDECISRMQTDQGIQIPVAYLTCNLTPPLKDQPALFTHDEVITLFHEFGHGLHHMLTRVDYPAVSGINGVEWDAVELPSQFMEFWCWDKTAIQLFAKHVDSGESLPDVLYEKMMAARNFQSALQMLRQVEFASFDMRLHEEYVEGKPNQISQILNEVRDQVSVFKPPAFNRFQHGFSHIFAGGYAAGYYSYKWAEVLSADAFSRFDAEPVTISKTVGQDFLQNILEKGGSAPAADLFAMFRGREPSIEALLHYSGISFEGAD